ncbi:ribulose-phosphate 3-epimerase [uncultured Dubosiella sp.]|jgi:ribulose-phosphate 3-epimerase|uniref:ribulose-phosphate 3-epimerase n=1 Tax=uncultured Dubosiella sp. TaxID=1937011 RepID=UPI00208AF065|nr:ribulose-phosphate 3-epimerase [uncultured Dubosiella sp.]GJM56415.1 ribulose-phosphate 3-epimerase [Erysipelotrichaceae bacterium OPF54]
MKERLLCPSMMCANYGHLASEVRALDDAGADIFHCDIMDGSFVPNFTMGVMDVQTIRRYTDKPVDCHLMIENPSSKVDWFIDAGADIIYIHPESERYVVKTLAHIKERGAYAGIAINPDTSIASVSDMLNLCDYVLVMTVNPGFAGQKFIDFTRKKVQALIELKEQYGFKVMIDGHCSSEVIEDLSALGADGFVLGSSALFRKGKTYKELIRQLKGVAE